jgi:hypothetical protein
MPTRKVTVELIEFEVQMAHLALGIPLGEAAFAHLP